MLQRQREDSKTARAQLAFASQPSYRVHEIVDLTRDARIIEP